MVQPSLGPRRHLGRRGETKAKAKKGAICRTVHDLPPWTRTFNPPSAFANCNPAHPFVLVVLDGSHSIPPELDFDWTLHKRQRSYESAITEIGGSKRHCKVARQLRSAAQGIRLIRGCSAMVVALTRQSRTPRSCGNTTLFSVKFSKATASMLTSSSKLLNVVVDQFFTFPTCKAE